MQDKPLPYRSSVSSVCLGEPPVVAAYKLPRVVSYFHLAQKDISRCLGNAHEQLRSQLQSNLAQKSTLAALATTLGKLLQLELGELGMNNFETQELDIL
eukprot:6144188-Amphidinium_carterae.1